MAEELNDSQAPTASPEEPRDAVMNGAPPTTEQPVGDSTTQVPGEPQADASEGAAPEGSPAPAASEQPVAEESSDDVPDTPAPTSPFEPPDFSAAGPATDTSAIDMLDDVELDVKIELGRTEMYIEEVLGLGSGSVVKLDKAAGDPVDIFINERLVARGEVLVLDDRFCVRINDILSPIPELESDR